MANNHQAIRDNVIVGDMLLSRKVNSPISRVIAGITRSNWSHSFLYIGDDKIIESDWNGVVIKRLEYYLNDKFTVGLFRVKPELTEDETDRLVKEMRKLLGIHYGYLQLVWQFILRLIGRNEDPDWAIDVDTGMICSEAMATAYKKIGRQIKNLPPHQTEPEDFDSSSITIRIA